MPRIRRHATARTMSGGHMKAGKLVHRTVSPEQATKLRLAIANYRKAKKLIQAWEDVSERLIAAEATREP